MSRNSPDYRNERGACFYRLQIGGRNLGSFREVGIGDLQSPLSLVDDIGKSVFEWNARHVA